MPELPEVEVIRRALGPLIAGKQFDRPRLLFPGTVRHPSPDHFCERLPDRQVIEPARKGKYLLIGLDRGTLVVHLRMTGRLVFSEKQLPAEQHLRVILPFKDETALYFSDMRKFGGLWLLENYTEFQLAGLHRLGPDIYEQVSPDLFIALLEGRPRAKIKPILLDQGFIAGMGNIYVDESLFRARIHPCREASSLTRKEKQTLYREIRAVLEEGIQCGGASMRDYRNARGEEGGFQRRLSVYGCKGHTCRCGGVIERIVVAGRGTHFCPHCQKLKEKGKPVIA